MLCFIHIERAGGTTLHYILRHNFLSFLTLSPSLRSNEGATALTAAELHALLRVLPFTKGFGGHTTRAYAGYERAGAQPINYFTFLRSPIDRYVSHFQYQVDRMRIPWTFGQFLSEPHFANFMTTRIAGRPDVERAKELLRDRFSFIGLTERFDESLLLMRHALGLPDFDVRYERQNAGRDRGNTMSSIDSPGTEDVTERIRSQNLLDLELYRFAREELYPEYVGRYGPQLSSDLERFRTENEGFRFRTSRRYAWGLYRKFGYEPIEQLIRRAYRGSARALAPSDLGV